MDDEKILQSICVYCGSSDKVDRVYLEAARAMGAELAGRNMRLIFGGGKTGLMGAVAEAALAGGAEVVGVIPELFDTPALTYTHLSTLEVVDTMHTRKARMAKLADAFVALPGGYGTFEELFEMLTWAQIGLHSKPVGVLNVNHYIDPLIQLIDHALQEGFIYEEHQDLLQVTNDPKALLDGLARFKPPLGLDRWLTRPEDGYSH